MSRLDQQLARYHYVRGRLRDCGYETLPKRIPARLAKIIRKELGLEYRSYVDLMRAIRLLEHRERRGR